LLVLNKFEDFPKDYKGCVLALGTFDGIHLGHVDIINTAKRYAGEHGKKMAVFSFKNHPLAQIAPDRTPSMLCCEIRKKELLRKLSIDVLFNMYFDKNFASISSTQFILTLNKYFAPSCIVVGNNYSYGYLGAGTAATLARDGEKYGFDVIVQDLVKVDDIVVSSTNIRKYIIAGNIDNACKLLGRRYALSGKVVQGDARGRTLGFPTANLKITPENQTVPADGVYAAAVKIGKKTLPAVVSVGNNPTFSVRERRVEAHILNFDKDIYGKTIQLSFIARIRDEKKFANIDELVFNIKQDIVFTQNLSAASN
jgi:riboflavin kinase/FMN adenylyltransferase